MQSWEGGWWWLFEEGGGRGGGVTHPFQNTYPFLGLHMRATDAAHQSTDERSSAPVHGRKKLHGEGTG